MSGAGAPLRGVPLERGADKLLPGGGSVGRMGLR